MLILLRKYIQSNSPKVWKRINQDVIVNKHINVFNLITKIINANEHRCFIMNSWGYSEWEGPSPFNV